MSSARVFHVVEMPNARGDYHVQGTDMVLYDVSPNAKSMLGALYNKWQTVEGFGKDGVIFVTPFGMFATYSYHVGPIEEIVAVANRLERDWNKVGDRIENDVRASWGSVRQKSNASRISTATSTPTGRQRRETITGK